MLCFVFRLHIYIRPWIIVKVKGHAHFDCEYILQQKSDRFRKYLCCYHVERHLPAFDWHIYIAIAKILRITNKVGSIPEPCTTDRLMTRVNDHFCHILANCVLYVKNEIIHCITLSEILSDYNLLIKMMWSTESKTLEKPISRQRTDLLVCNNIDILCVISIIAAVVMPVFLKPYWSNSSSVGIEGTIRFLTICRSTVHDNIGVALGHRTIYRCTLRHGCNDRCAPSGRQHTMINKHVNHAGYNLG